MTLVIAAKGADFVVLGADTRGTTLDPSGNRVEINSFRKISSVNTRVAVLLHGEASAANYLLDQLRAERSIDRLGVSQVAQKLYKLGTAQMRETPPSAWKLMPQFGLIVAGVDRPPRHVAVPKCLGLSTSDGFWPHSYDHFAIRGKPLIANYLFAQRYKEDLVVNAMTELVAQALYDTMNVDGDVGGDMDVMIIDGEGSRTLLKEDLPDLITAWGRPLLYLTPTRPDTP